MGGCGGPWVVEPQLSLAQRPCSQACCCVSGPDWFSEVLQFPLRGASQEGHPFSLLLRDLRDTQIDLQKPMRSRGKPQHLSKSPCLAEMFFPSIFAVPPLGYRGTTPRLQRHHPLTLLPT